MNKKLFLVVGLFILTGVLGALKSSDNISIVTTDDSNTQNFDTAQDATWTIVDDKEKYVNNIAGISFIVPEGWHVSRDHVDNGVVKNGLIQMFNYTPGEPKSGFPLGQNKIEGTISPNNKYSLSADDIYTPENLKEYVVVISNKNINVAEGNYGDIEFKTYYVPTKISDKYLTITIYGDIKNFYILDNLVKSL